jgi:hypothetical protein
VPVGEVSQSQAEYVAGIRAGRGDVLEEAIRRLEP